MSQTECNIACFDCRKLGNCSYQRFAACTAKRKMRKTDFSHKITVFRSKRKPRQRYTDECYQNLAADLGYPDQKTMWIDLYTPAGQDLSLPKINQVLGMGVDTIRRQLLRHGITLRRKGGCQKDRSRW
jgi:hypothetical protein